MIVPSPSDRRIILFGCIAGVLFFLFFLIRIHQVFGYLEPGRSLLALTGSFLYSFGLGVGYYLLRDSFLKKLTIFPIVGHVVYFVLLYFLSAYVGFVMAPVWAYKLLTGKNLISE